MTPLHSLLPELAQREVRCLHVLEKPGGSVPAYGLPVGEYAYLEFYCEDLGCDCRRVFLQVISRDDPNTVLASINYGWEKEAFYRKRMPWEPDAARDVVRGDLDPINEQSEFSEELLNQFQHHVLDEPYRLRLRRHYRQFREEVARRAKEG